MLHVVRHLHEALIEVVHDDADIAWASSLTVLDAVARMRSWPPDEVEQAAAEVLARIDEEVQAR